jgi:hypothetical protein
METVVFDTEIESILNCPLFLSFSVCLSQAVNQTLLADPLVSPQLTAKDFYMTGMYNVS